MKNVLHFDDLQLLLEIVAAGSFSKVAAARGWSQPQVSQRVAAIEAHLQVSLFQRHRRGAVATQACLNFLPHAQQALQAWQQGCDSLTSPAALPKITLASLPSLSGVILGELVRRLANDALELVCLSDHSSVILEMILDAEVDLGFMVKRPGLPGISMQSLVRTPVVAFCSPQHPLAKVSRLKIAQLANERLAPLNWGPACQDLVAQLKQARKVSGGIHVIEPASAVRELALEQGYISFAPDLCIRKELQAGTLVRLALSDLPHSEWHMMMAWRAQKRQQDGRKRVLQEVQNLVQEWRGETR